MNTGNLPAAGDPEYNRKYYLAHRDHLLAKAKEYYAKNRDSILEYQKRHSKKHSVVERRKVLQKARRKLPGMQKYMSAYRQNNHQKIMRKNHEYWTKRENQPRRKFYVYRRNAEKRNIGFDLSLEEFVSIAEKPCFYCGEISAGAVNGIDRHDNSRGYVLGNVVSCCWNCNRMKGTLTETEFLKKCQLILEHMHLLNLEQVET